jgi:hypothetical protein
MANQIPTQQDDPQYLQALAMLRQQIADKAAAQQAPTAQLPQDLNREQILNKYYDSIRQQQSQNPDAIKKAQEASQGNWGQVLASFGAGLQGQKGPDWEAQNKARFENSLASQQAAQNLNEGLMKQMQAGSESQRQQSVANVAKGTEGADIQKANLAAKQMAMSTQGAELDLNNKKALNRVDSPESDALRQVAIQYYNLPPETAKLLSGEGVMKYMGAAGVPLTQNYERRIEGNKNLNQYAKERGEMTQRSLAGGLQSRVLQGGRLLTLINSAPNGDLNQLMPEQVEELGSGLNALIANGAGSEAGREALVPVSGVGKLNKIIQGLKNEPTGAGMGKFVERIKHTIERENAFNTSERDKEFAGIDKNYERYRPYDPAAYDAIKNTYNQPAAQQSQDVLDYAKTHNISPEQAAQVKASRTGK